MRELHHNCPCSSDFVGECDVSAAPIRNIAYAGALVTGMLLYGFGAATASADTDDYSGAGVDHEPAYSDVETPSGSETSGGGQSSADGGPTSTIGNGRNDVVDPNETTTSNRTTSDGSTTGAASTGGSTTIVRSPRKFAPSVRITILRMPTIAEIRRPGLTPPTAFIATADIGLLTPIQDVWRAIAEPTPDPRPSPSFRTQQEEAPVIDATGNTTGGTDVGTVAESPPVVNAPIVVAPRAPAAVAPRPAPTGSAPPAAPAAAQPAVAGVRTPPIRGSLTPSGTIPVTRALSQATGQTAPAGMPRLLRNPTVGELAIVALPGVGGLLMLILSGGVIGYRQANSDRYARTDAVARFLA
jgi:hypothetical protein